MKDLLKKGVAECIGTLVLVFIGCGVGALFGASNVVATALAFGLSVTLMCYTIGRISGCHVNPAISLAMLLNKKITIKEFFVYIVAQFLGALLGALLLYVVINSYQYNGTSIYAQVGLGTNAFSAEGSGVSMLGAIIVEAVLTFIFCYGVLGVTGTEKFERISGVVIGFDLALVHLFGIPFTGTSVNPARSFGPAIATQIFSKESGVVTSVSQLWVFIVAPLVGAIIAGLLFRFFNTPKEITETTKVKKETKTKKEKK